MAGSAVIGALRVALGIDTAQFSQGLTGAQSRLKKFGSVASKAFGAAAVAGTAVTAALAVGIQRTVKEADEMTKLAQSIGVPVEELTRLKHAADLSGVGIDGLAKSLGRLSRGMTDIATGAGQETKKAFDALGITVMNADGTLKSSQQVLTEVADRFAAMEDGATKTGLAMTIFGRSGAQLVPMLNQGASGIKQMTDEADRLGLTLDANTGQAAEAFNDNLTRLGKVKDGIILKITSAMLPTLERVSESFLATAEKSDFMKGTIENLAIALDALVAVGVTVRGTFQAIGATISGVADAIKLSWDGQWQAARESLRGMGDELAKIFADTQKRFQDAI
ncbi:MAG: hypothetical protein VYD64_02695, partial [Pseudomonadota bacterium]|nr:hypothetical protein [Pseudomonadota bacterium]